MVMLVSKGTPSREMSSQDRPDYRVDADSRHTQRLLRLAIRRSNDEKNSENGAPNEPDSGVVRHCRLRPDRSGAYWARRYGYPVDTER